MDDGGATSLAANRVDLLQAFDLPSRLVAGEECLGNGGEVRAGRGLEFHRSGPIDCESDQRRSRTGLAGPALSFCGISCRSILLRKSRRGGMADAEDLKSSGRERPCGFDRGARAAGQTAPRAVGPGRTAGDPREKSEPSLLAGPARMGQVAVGRSTSHPHFPSFRNENCQFS